MDQEPANKSKLFGYRRKQFIWVATRLCAGIKIRIVTPTVPHLLDVDLLQQTPEGFDKSPLFTGNNTTSILISNIYGIKAMLDKRDLNSHYFIWRQKCIYPKRKTPPQEMAATDSKSVKATHSHKNAAIKIKFELLKFVSAVLNPLWTHLAAWPLESSLEAVQPDLGNLPRTPLGYSEQSALV